MTKEALVSPHSGTGTTCSHACIGWGRGGAGLMAESSWSSRCLGPSYMRTYVRALILDAVRPKDQGTDEIIGNVDTLLITYLSTSGEACHGGRLSQTGWFPALGCCCSN